jgi:hypothetical protein
MTLKQATLLPLICVLGACASDGGGRGSGITTVVEGDVESVQTAALPGRTATEGIHVTVEGTSAQGETDAAGRFSIRGDFDGPGTLLFQRPSDGITAEVSINVPAGGTLTISNVRIDNVHGVAIPESQSVDFTGTITATNCLAQTLTLASVGTNDLDRYTLQLDTSSVQDIHGNILACADIRAGQRAMIHGMVNPDGSFGEAVVEVEG